MEQFFNLGPKPDLSAFTVLASFLMAFFLTVLLAKAYEYTHRGLSYSRSYVQALILGGLTSCMVIMAIGNSIVVGIGLMGTLAIVRFRSTMKDPKDMIYIFSALGIGIACGVRQIEVATIGAIVFCLAAVFLKDSPFTKENKFEAVLRLKIPQDKAAENLLNSTLKHFCSEYVLMNLREASQGNEIELSYYLTFKSKRKQLELIDELNKIDGLSDLSLIPQEAVIQV